MARPAHDHDSIAAIARLRFEDGLSQGEIARRLGVSEATVSRAIKRAFAAGILEIRVTPAGWRDAAREAALCRTLGLDRAVVVSPPRSGQTADLARATASALETMVAPGDVIGVSDGAAVAAVAAAARRVAVRGIEVVPLIGGIGAPRLATHSGEVSRVLAAGLGARSWQLPVPAIVDSADIARLLAASAALAEPHALIARASIALFGIGAMDPSASILRHGMIGAEAVNALARDGAAGSICGRFFNAHGVALTGETDGRTMAISLEALTAIPVRLAVAAGDAKVDAIHAAARGGLITALATDAATADALA
ncbi:sugar-binding domain-containing protein [Acuticoccus sp. MNP-M23]|uniref:sugar-binding transcriptional regulator n=1 Tax=Acuticoccus sp. MNP-M23 TaxID=3072793 RepID=UPI0028150FD7|nr:sugar-binding domain-containing protein [Acuticoccus sp. MNP-M23]WMS41442.1 sugar-binding domain-containing protein [Acuticoccus sp. MNP-M23]